MAHITILFKYWKLSFPGLSIYYFGKIAKHVVIFLA